MEMSWADFNKKLPRVKQCKTCPWKKSTAMDDIEEGFDMDHYESVRDDYDSSGMGRRSPSHIMCCHKHDDDDPAPCVGWIMNQVQGNMGLYIQILTMENADKLEVFGPQHANIRDFFTDK